MADEDVTPPAAPATTVSEIQKAIADLVAKVEADVAALVARLPAEAQPGAGQIEHIVKMALDGFNWTAFRSTLAAELIALLSTGRSEAPHDPSELA